jgi:hypothetical protein
MSHSPPLESKAPHCRRRAFASAGRPILVWTLLFYLGFQVALTAITDHWLPVLRDPEYGHKLARLQTRLGERPGRELIVILGSSRSGYGFRPDVVSAWPSLTGEPPIVFNFAMTGSGPIMELLCLRRLLRAGIHPDRLFIEVLPPSLHQEGAWAEMAWLNINRLGWRDLQLVRRYSASPEKLWFDWCRSQSTPWFTQRFCIMSRYAAGWCPWETRQDIWLGLDRSGWMVYPHTILDAAEHRRAVEFARRQYALPLDHFRITAVADRALRELLSVCRHQGIAATLVLMPEGTEFQSWYAPEARAQIDHYLPSVSREYDVPLVDARCWLPDNAFFDSHHLHPDGATAFTQRFAREMSRRSVVRNP